MAVVTYKCDTCNREINKIRNTSSLEIVGPCIITDGCHGRLYQTDFKQDYIRGELPKDVPGLDNWSQRKALFIHKQTFSSAEWLITHNLEVRPAVIVYVETADGYDEIEPLAVSTIDENTIKVNLSVSSKGIVHCIARATSMRKGLQEAKIKVKPETSVRISSNGGNISFATRSDDEYFKFALYTDINTNPRSSLSDNFPSTSSTWFGMPTNRVLINNQVYYLRDVSTQFLEELNDAVTLSMLLPDQTESYWLTPERTDILILLANEPYTSNDKAFDKFIDLSAVNGAMYYKDGEWYTDADFVQTIYPFITSV